MKRAEKKGGGGGMVCCSNPCTLRSFLATGYDAAFQINAVVSDVCFSLHHFVLVCVPYLPPDFFVFLKTMVCNPGLAGFLEDLTTTS